MLLVSFCRVTGVYTGVSPTAEAVLKQSRKSQLRARILPFMYCLYSSLLHDDRISLRSILYANGMVSG